MFACTSRTTAIMVYSEGALKSLAEQATVTSLNSIPLLSQIGRHTGFRIGFTRRGKPV